MDREEERGPVNFDHKRKRKTGFFSRAKKFGKQGKLGRGFQVEENSYSYFLRVLEICHKNEFENDEERDLFVANSIEQTENEEINLSSNQLTSRVVETLISLSKDADTLARFTIAFTPSLRTICTDPFASHVLEKLLEVISERWLENKKLVKWFRTTSKYILNNFEEFVFNKYASHVMRKTCQCLSGSVGLFSSKLQQHNASSNRIVMPSLEKFKSKSEGIVVQDSEAAAKARKRNIKILKAFVVQFLNWPQFFDLFHEETTSGLVQCLILTTKVIGETELVSQAIGQVINAIKEDIDLESNVYLHTLEQCLSASNENEDDFRLIYDKYFKSKLSTFAVHSQGHYLVETLCRCAPSKELFQEIFEELEANFLKIYKTRYLSVFSVLAEGCKRLGTKQSTFANNLAELLEQQYTDNSKEKEKQSKLNFVEMLCHFGKTLDVTDGETVLRTELHGTLILQHLFDFHKPFKVVGSLLEQSGPNLFKLATDPKGSHVIDAFFRSTSVGEKNKENLLQKLKDHMVTMACGKFGARVLDNMWPLCSIKNKSLIASALSPREAQLNANQYGKFLSQKCGLHLFKRDPKQWSELIGQGNKRKHELSELLAEIGVASSTLEPKKKKSETTHS